MGMPRLLLLRGATGSGKSSVAARVKSRYPDVEVIEVDDIKLRKYGTTVQCNPDEDFPEAGRRAADSLAAGRPTVVVETFRDEEHLRSVLSTAGLDLDSPNVCVAWLECSLDTSLHRKAAALSPETIRHEHTRCSERFHVQGEHVINTDSADPSDLASRLLHVLLGNQDAGPD